MCASRSPVRPRPPPRRALRSDVSDDRDAFHRVTPSRVSPAVEPRLLSGLKALRGCAHRSGLGAAADRVSKVVRRAPGLAPRRRFALRLLVRHDARCVGPISANLSSSYQHPRLVGFRCVTCLRTCAPNSRLVHISAIGFGGPHVSLSCHRGGRFLPTVTRGGRTSDIPVASLTIPMALARPRVTVRVAEIISECPCERSARRNDPECLPSDKDLCPATPSRASGSGLPRERGLATATSVVDAVSPPWNLSDPRRPGPCARDPVATGSRASCGPWRRLPTSATCMRRAGTPDERFVLARERGFRSATRRHQPMPVASVSTVRCRIGDQRATTRTRRLDARRVPLAWTGQVVGRNARVKANARS
jgi:hypothetical protein